MGNELKAAFFDVDWTLYDHKAKRYVPSGIAAINELKHKGVKVFICSARPYESLRLFGAFDQGVKWDGFIACAGAYEQALRRDTPKIKFFTAGIILGIGILLWGVFSGRSPVTGAGIGLLGATVLLLPFATPETVRLLGYRKSRALGRLLGLLLVAVGLWVGIF